MTKFRSWTSYSSTKGVSNKWEDLVFGRLERNDRENASSLYLPGGETETWLIGSFEFGTDGYDPPCTIRSPLLHSFYHSIYLKDLQENTFLRVSDLPQSRSVME